MIGRLISRLWAPPPVSPTDPATKAYVDQTSVQDLSAPTFASWTIDPVNGSDNAPNGGTLKTAKAWKKRMGNQSIPIAMSISQLGDLATTDRWDLEGITMGEAGTLTIDGSAGVTVASELPALTAVTSIDTTQPNDCAQYVTITGHTWAETGSQVRIKAGGSTPNAISYVGTDMTAGKARMAPFILNPTFNSSNVNPAVNDVLQVLALPKGRNLVLAGVNTNVTFKSIDFDDQDGNGHGLTGAGFSGSTFIGCILRGFFFFTQNVSLYHCQVASGGTFFGSDGAQATVCGGRFVSGSAGFQLGSLAIDNHALFEGVANIRIFGTSGNLMTTIGKVGVYGVSAGAVVVAQGAVALFGNSLSGQSRLYGSASYNVEARSYGRVFYDAAQTEATIFKVLAGTAKYLQGVTTRTALPAAVDANGNSILAWV